METQMAGSISRLDGNMSQDAVFKDILAYKEVLAHMRCTPGQVIQILEEEYDFSSARNMEGTVTAVCNLSQGFIEEGRERGMKEGRAQGADQERLRSIPQSYGDHWLAGGPSHGRHENPGGGVCQVPQAPAYATVSILPKNFIKWVCCKMRFLQQTSF